MNISDLWHCGKELDWKEALTEYCKVTSVGKNIDLERRMQNITPEYVRNMTIDEFYQFLYNEYFVWKYTAKNRLTTTRKLLTRYKVEGMDQLEKARVKIFKAYYEDPEDTEELLWKTQHIHGLGTAGASGLLSILFPKHYGTLDQYVVRALFEIKDLDEFPFIEKIHRKIDSPKNSYSLTIDDGVILENILRCKAKELNAKFNSDEWSPRKIDMILFASRDDK